MFIWWSIGSYLIPNIFIQLVHCPWLLSYLIVCFIIIISWLPWYYIYVEYLCYYYMMIFWIWDSIREYTSTYDMLYNLFFLVYCVFVLSESLFFISFFWSSFTLTCSIICNYEGLYIVYLNGLSLTNMLLLSNSGLYLGCIYVICVVHMYLSSVCYLCSLFWLFMVLIFLSLQSYEFISITFYMSETIYIGIFFVLTGLHWFHILIGIVLIDLMLYISSVHKSVLNIILFLISVFLHTIFYTLQLVYWHFVELLWLFIYLILYN